MDIQLSITLTLPDLPSTPRFPRLERAVQQAAQDVQAAWRGYTVGVPTASGRSMGTRTGAYAKSIKLRQEGPTAWTVYSDAPHARALEYGTPATDLKKALQGSAKARVNKRGKRYLVIPMDKGRAGARSKRFLTMSEDSAGWVRPAQPGFFPARSAVEEVMPGAEPDLQAALQADMDAIFNP